MKSFGEQLSEARKLKGITQEHLAEMLGITRQGISNWERGRTFPDLDAIKQLSHILNYEFTVTDGLLGDTPREAPAEEHSEPEVPEKKKSRRIIPLACFLAGALIMFLLLQVFLPMLNRPDERPAYVQRQDPGGLSGPETVAWFTRKSAPASGKPYVVVSFSENPIYAERDADYSNGIGWNYTVYFTEYNNHAFYPESYTEYLFRDEGHAVSLMHTADELAEWWHGEPCIVGRGQQCVTGGKPLQDIIGIGIKLAGKDENGEEMEFYGYMECLQQSRN